MGLNFNTPLEEYKLSGRSVFVKRDDLHNGDLDLPPWAKIEGVRQLLMNEDIIQRSRPIVHLTVRGSYTGWVLGHYGKQYGYDVKIAYPNAKNYPKEALDRIESYGVELVPIKPNMMQIVYNKMGQLAEENEWQKMPYAFDHPVYHSYWEDKVTEFCKTHDFDNLVILGGSGVTSTGMVRGFMDTENFMMNKRIYIVCSSTVSSVTSKLKEWKSYYPTNITIHDTPYEFYDEMDFYETPFPCNVNWDKKAWWWLEQNIDKLEGSVLFWNIGA